jgi:hypothetical protein
MDTQSDPHWIHGNLDGCGHPRDLWGNVNPMVQYNEESVSVTVETPSPFDFIHEFQTGALEVVQTVLSTIDHEELVIGNETTQGCWNILEMVKATLPDPKTMEKVHELMAKHGKSVS